MRQLLNVSLREEGGLSSNSLQATRWAVNVSLICRLLVKSSPANIVGQQDVSYEEPFSQFRLSSKAVYVFCPALGSSGTNKLFPKGFRHQPTIQRPFKSLTNTFFNIFYAISISFSLKILAGLFTMFNKRSYNLYPLKFCKKTRSHCLIFRVKSFLASYLLGEIGDAGRSISPIL